MPHITINSVFSNPALVGQMAQRLSPHELLQFSITCRSLSVCLEPYLWRHVLIKDNSPTLQLLFRKLHLVRSIDLSSEDPVYLEIFARGLPRPLLPTSETGVTSVENSEAQQAPEKEEQRPDLRIINLVNLPLNPLDQARPTLDFLSILNHSPVLTHLRMQTAHVLNQESSSEPFLKALSNKLPILQSLTFEGCDAVSPEPIVQLLRVCFRHPQLAELKCDFEMRCLDARPRLIAQLFRSLLYPPEEAEADGECSGYKMKSLKLPHFKPGYRTTVLSSLLKKYTPNLERFDVPRIQDDSVDTEDDVEQDSVADDTLANSLPNLQHISCWLFDIDEFDKQAALSVIRAAANGKGLKTFKAIYFEDLNYFGESRNVLRTLAQLHSATLEEIDLQAVEKIQSMDLELIFTTCKKLKTFRAVPCDCGQVAIDFRDMLSPWVCLEMTQLCLTLNRFDVGEAHQGVMGMDDSDESGDDDADTDGDQAAAPSVAKTVYAQIGQLVKLESLSLSGDKSEIADASEKDFQWDLTLKRGWLSELAGLRRLKHFHMVTDFWTRMGQREVEFMAENWPRLASVSFDDGYEGQTCVWDEPHWQWLKEQIPHLKYRYSAFSS